MGRWLAASILALLGAAPRAAELTVFRCVGADGAVALQDRPCPPQMREEARRLRRPLDPPPGARPAPAPALPDPGAPAPEPAAAPRAPAAPAPRYECLRPDGSRYESADGRGEPRWVPLWTLGADPRAPARTFGRTGARPAPRPAFRPGAPAQAPDPASLGPGVWIADACRPLSPGEICARRRDRIDELERRARSSATSEARRLREERAALREQYGRECG